MSNHQTSCYTLATPFTNSALLHLLYTTIFLFLGFTIVLKSTIGKLGRGNSIIGIIIAISKYHPNIAAAQKHDPHPTSKFAAKAMLPFPIWKKEPAANPKPSVAATKTRKKMRFVRVEQMRKMAERMQRERG